MMLLIQTAIIFFGTLMAAAVVALGEPARAEVETARVEAPQASPSVLRDRHAIQQSVDVASAKQGFSVR